MTPGQAAPSPDAPRRRTGRPRTPILTRQGIFETALELLDESGHDGFGMRDIARRLEVQVSALYKHVSGKEEILSGIRDLIVNRIGTESLDEPSWDEALRHWARSYRDAFAAHPPTIALLSTMPLDPASNASLAYERVIDMLGREGWSPQQAIDILVALESFILGSALDAAAAPDMLDPGPRDDVPRFREAYRAREEVAESRGVRPADLAFETGLSLLLIGLRAQHAGIRHAGRSTGPDRTAAAHPGSR